MKYVGVDLHKHLIVLCVVVLVAGRPKVVSRPGSVATNRRPSEDFFKSWFRFKWSSRRPPPTNGSSC